MLIATTVFHLLGLALLIGGGVINGILLNRAGTSDDTARASLRSATRRVGQVTFFGLVILWISGFFLVTDVHGGWSGLSTFFWAKIVTVVILSVSSLAAQIYSIMAIFSGSRTPRIKVIRLTAITTLLAIVALVLAAANNAV